jgi:hypothetical protein
LTLIFIPDTTGLDLREQERYWQSVRVGRVNDFHGIAIHPRHLSWYERAVLKRHTNYDPELDRKTKIAELRALYQEMNASTGKESLSSRGTDDVSDKVMTYFQSEKNKDSNQEKAT